MPVTFSLFMLRDVSAVAARQRVLMRPRGVPALTLPCGTPGHDGAPAWLLPLRMATLKSGRR